MGTIVNTVGGIGILIVALCILLSPVGCAFTGNPGSASNPGKNLVYCPKCHKALYKKDKICPKDHAPLNGYKYWFWEKGRLEPRMMYPAETYLIKKDGKLIWYPHEIELHEPGQN